MNFDPHCMKPKLHCEIRHNGKGIISSTIVVRSVSVQSPTAYRYKISLACARNISHRRMKAVLGPTFLASLSFSSAARTFWRASTYSTRCISRSKNRRIVSCKCQQQAENHLFTQYSTLLSHPRSSVQGSLSSSSGIPHREHGHRESVRILIHDGHSNVYRSKLKQHDVSLLHLIHLKGSSRSLARHYANFCLVLHTNNMFTQTRPRNFVSTRVRGLTFSFGTGRRRFRGISRMCRTP